MKKVNFKNSVIALVIALVMVSCDGEKTKKQGETFETESTTQTEQTSSTEDISTSTLVGTWTDDMKTISYEFRTGGTGVLKHHEAADKKEETFTWKVEGKKISLDFEDGNFNQFEYIGTNKLEDMMRRPFTKQ